MAATVILLEIDVTSPAGVASTLRFSDRAMRPFPPTDPDRPNVVWDDRLKTPPSIRRALFDDLATLSPGLGFGAFTLANADRDLDPYQAYAWGEYRVYRWTEGTAFAAASLLMTGLCGMPGYDADTERPGVVDGDAYDYRQEAERQLQTTLYAGTNGVGGVLYEGAADGLKGRPKPLAYGNLLDAHVPAPIVNNAKFVSQLHDGAFQGFEQIFDRGDAAGFIDDGNQAGAAFDAAAPAAAHYVTDITRGLVKVNGSPVGQVAFGLKGDSTGGYVETAGPILARILTRIGVPAGRIGASVASLASAATIGAYYADPVQAREALGWIARSAPAALLPGRTGVWEALPFGPPAGVAADTIPTDEIIHIDADKTAPAPAGEVRVGWGRVFTGYRTADLAPALKGTATETRLIATDRFAVVSDATTKARFPRTWRTIEITTALRVEADAQALASALMTLFGLRADGAPRRMWRVTLRATDARLARSLGDTIALQYPTYGIDDRFVLIGEELLRPNRDQLIWTLWG